MQVKMMNYITAYQLYQFDRTVDHITSTKSENVVSKAPYLEMLPEDIWEHDFIVEAEEVPKLDFKFIFSVLFEVFRRTIGEIKKDSKIYTVLATEVLKVIKPPEVGAYANTNMEIVNTITNIGTESIDTADIIDRLPVDIIPPYRDQIKLVVKNQDGTIEIHERTEFIKKITTEPEDKSPEHPHEIIVSLKDLQKLLPPRQN